MKSFKKIAILSAIFVAILGFFVWKYYQDKQKKKIITIMCTLTVVTTKLVILNF